MHHTPATPEESFREVAQIGVVVRDLDKAIQALTEIFGVGPFRTNIYPPPGRTGFELRYHGEPAAFSYRQAFADLGNVELELIQPLTGETIWSDFLEKHGEGIHHIRFNVPDIAPVEAYLSAHNIFASMSGPGLRPGTGWMNFDTEDCIGFTIEVMKALPGTSGRTPEIVDGAVVG